MLRGICQVHIYIFDRNHMITVEIVTLVSKLCVKIETYRMNERKDLGWRILNVPLVQNNHVIKSHYQNDCRRNMPNSTLLFIGTLQSPGNVASRWKAFLCERIGYTRMYSIRWHLSESGVNLYCKSDIVPFSFRL